MKHLILLAVLFSAPVYASDIARPPEQTPGKRMPSIFWSDSTTFLLDTLSIAGTKDSVTYSGVISENGHYTAVVEIGNCRDQTHAVIITNGVLKNVSGSYKLQPVKSGTVDDQVLNTVCRAVEDDRKRLHELTIEENGQKP